MAKHENIVMKKQTISNFLSPKITSKMADERHDIAVEMVKQGVVPEKNVWKHSKFKYETQLHKKQYKGKSKFIGVEHNKEK